MNYWFLWRNSSFSKKIGSAFLLLALSFASVSAYANAEPAQMQASQQRGTTVTGTVVDVNGELLIGVNVEEEGTYNGTATDIDGNFSLTLTNATSNIVFSYLGYDDVTVKPTLNAMKIVLTESSTTLDEVVVVGYGAQKKESVVGSIAQVKGDELKSKGAVSNITDALSGTMPGVTVMTSNGNPGGGGDFGDESVILVRGMTTWNEASPLVLVDGVERNMNDVDINEIESFSVLKDASATAVFGVKGANGVILINTKRGQAGEATISFEANIAVKSISELTNVADSYDGLLARNYGVVAGLPYAPGNASDIWSKYTSNRVLEMYRNNVDPEKYTNVDWRDVMLRDQAFSQKYNASISGGTDFVKYFTSIGYIYEGDILETVSTSGYKPEFRYDRFNFRTNLDFQLTSTTQFKVNLSGYYGKQQTPGCGTNDMWYGLYKYDPAGYLPVYSDGVYGMDYSPSERVGTNSFFALNTGGVDINNRTSITTDFQLDQDLEFVTKGLSLKGKFSYDNFFKTAGVNIKDGMGNYVAKGYDIATGTWIWKDMDERQDGFEYAPTPLGYTAETATAAATARNVYYEFALNYNRKFGDHNIGALALFSREHRTTGSGWPQKREDWVGRFTYDYKGKYLFETNGAYNGSELFGPDYRFDFFPSMAIGWRASEEKFIKENLPFISNLKFKYSIGMIGNDNLKDVSQWAYVTSWVDIEPGKNNANYPFFGSNGPVLTPYPLTGESTPGNPFLQWETARKQNLGMEYGFFDGMISGNLDIFDESRTDMLVAAKERSIPDFFGQSAPAANLGEVYAKGLEFDIKVQKRIKEVNLWGSYNWSVAKNEVIYKEDPLLKPFYQKNAGYSIGQVKTNVVSGILSSWDEIYTTVKHKDATDNTIIFPGKYQTIDYNGNGMLDTDDGAPYGYAVYPQNTYGFAIGADYKGFALSLNFYGAYNVSIECGEFYDEFSFSSAFVCEELLDSTWTPEYGNSDADYRGLKALGVGTGPTGSANIVDGSFLRLKTAELSYTLPKSFVSKLSMEKVRLFVNGNNIFFWSDLPVDVEGANFELKKYPTVKQINFGANIVF